MSYNNLLYEVQDKIAIISVNRPEVLNALNWETIRELNEAVLSVRDDDSVGGMIVTGAGEKAFVAGADINELVQATALSGRET